MLTDAQSNPRGVYREYGYYESHDAHEGTCHMMKALDTTQPTHPEISIMFILNDYVVHDHIDSRHLPHRIVLYVLEGCQTISHCD
jgi:hypothetical protein